jgi:hypothetical protein
MPTLSEQKKSRSNRRTTKAQAAIDAAKAAREASLADRKMDQRINRAIAWMIGTTIRDLHKAGKLTVQQCVVVSEILEMREEKPQDWDLLAPYLPPPRPVAVPDLDAAE